MTAHGEVDHRPTLPGGAISLLAGAAAVALVAGAPGQLLALSVELGGLIAVAVGLEARRRGRAPIGWVIAAVGVAGIVAGLVASLFAPIRLTETIELVPGLLGLLVLAAGLVPVREGWSRTLVGAGAILLALCVVTSGVVHGTEKLPLLAAMALAVVAWDAGEQATNLGEQVGRGADTAAVEALHALGTAAVGALGVVLAVGIFGLDVTGVPLVGLALLLGAVLAIGIALYS